MFLRLIVLFICLLTISGLNLLSAEPFKLYDSGTEETVDYEKYGKFEGVGTENYKYVISDSAGLKKAVGEGIFPNAQAVYQDPAYKQLKEKSGLVGSHWEFVHSENYQANFIKWATASEEPGTKLYYTALALEKAGNIKQAIKAYYAVLVNFPRTIGITYWGTPWYMGQGAISKIRYLTRENPDLGLKLIDAYVKVKNSFDTDRNNDVFIINPGKLIKAKPKDFCEPRLDLAKLQIIKTVGRGKVKLVQYSNRHWQLLVDDKEYVIRGIAYSPNKVGLSPDNETLNVFRDWMYADYNKNGKIDGPYDAFVDKNYNNKQDKNEPSVGDFQLMKDMGINTIRLYHHVDLNKQLLMEGYKNYGFMYLMGDLIGMYAVGSKADWYGGTDYANPEHQKNMLESVRQVVEEYKDEPYILMWVLGNENNYGEPGVKGVSSGSGCRAKIQPEAYYKFVNEAAKLIKSLDPHQRPVAISNGDTLYLDICAANAPELDIFGVNAYRGEDGFGSLWQDISDVFDRATMITEYGCSAYNPDWTQKRAELGQAKYHIGNWINIESNFAGRGIGNALGGIAFEWVDEWWKANSDLPVKVQLQNKVWYAKRSAQYKNLQPGTHDTVPQFGAPFLDGWSYEEWLGISSQGDGKLSPFLRQLRPVYFDYKGMWKKYK